MRTRRGRASGRETLLGGSGRGNRYRPNRPLSFGSHGRLGLPAVVTDSLPGLELAAGLARTSTGGRRKASAACESRRGVTEGPSGTGASQRSRAVELRSRMAREPPRGPGSLSSTNRRAPDLCSASSGWYPASVHLRRGEPKKPNGPGASQRSRVVELTNRRAPGGVLGVVGHQTYARRRVPSWRGTVRSRAARDVLTEVPGR